MFHLVVSFSIMRAAALSILVFYKNNLQKCIEKCKPAVTFAVIGFCLPLHFWKKLLKLETISNPGSNVACFHMQCTSNC